MGHRFFRFSPSDVARRSNIFTNLHRRDSCLTVNNIWVFHSRGIYPILLRPKHVYLFFYFFQNRVTLLDFVPLPESTNQHYTVLTHNHVPMTLHRTPNTLLIPTMHSHPCHEMFSCTCNAIMPIVYIYECYIQNENYMCTLTHACSSMHFFFTFILKCIHNSGYYFTRVNIPCKHTSQAYTFHTLHANIYIHHIKHISIHP